jgi:tetratricopeptide (TPR) repeat protein
MALAPKEPEVFFQRAGYMSISNWQNCFFRHYRDNEKIDSTTWLSAFFSKETIANLQKAADLSPNNYEYISLATYFEWLDVMIQVKATNYTPDILSDAARKSTHNAMTRLENLSEVPDKKTAAGALENLGMLNITFGNSQAAATDFRRAISLDPTREQSWDILLGTLKDSASPDELVAICTSRLKYKNSARNHLLLGKLYANQKIWDKATEQAAIANEFETNNIISSLLLAAVALKQSDQTNYLSIADINLSRAKAILEKTPDNDEKTKRWREFMLDGAIFCALNNQPEIARDWAKEVLKYFPNDETAQEILKNLRAN